MKKKFKEATLNNQIKINNLHWGQQNQITALENLRPHLTSNINHEDNET